MDQPSLSSSPGSAPVSPWAPQLPPSAPEPPAPSPLKKFLPLLGGLILVIILGLLIFKVFLPKVQKPQEVTLNYWGLWETESVVSGVLADWQKTHPNIKINYSRQSPKEYRERLQSALARNEGPDIFRFHISWMPMLKNELAPVPPEVLSSSQFESGFYPVAKDNLKVGTGFLGIPLEPPLAGMIAIIFSSLFFIDIILYSVPPLEFWHEKLDQPTRYVYSDNIF